MPLLFYSWGLVYLPVHIKNQRRFVIVTFEYTFSFFLFIYFLFAMVSILI